MHTNKSCKLKPNAQIAIVAVLLSLAFVLAGTRFYCVVVLRLGSLAIAALALAWFAQCAFDLPLPLPF